MNIAVDESRVTEVSIKAEQARVLLDVLLNGYFDQDIKSPDDFWKLSGYYYDNARIIIEIILSLTYDAEKIINEIVEESEIVRGGYKWLRNFNILMGENLLEMRAQAIICAPLIVPMESEKGCMYMFGNIIMVLSRMVIMFTILMEIKAIILLKTLECLKERNTKPFMV